MVDADVLAEIDAVLALTGASAENPKVRTRSEMVRSMYTDRLHPAEVPDGPRLVWGTALRACITRVTTKPVHLELVAKVGGEVEPDRGHLNRLVEILVGIRWEIEQGYARTISERVEDAVFSDFAGMARHIARTAHPAPAVVLAVSVLEERIRRLADATAGVDALDGKGNPRSFEALVTDLTRPEIGVLRKSQYKELAAWYALRTDCAHGRNLDSVSKEDAFRLIDGVEGYLAKLA